MSKSTESSNTNKSKSASIASETPNKSKSASIASETPNKGKKMAKSKIKKFRIYWKDGTNSLVHGETFQEALASSGKDISLFEYHRTL